MSEQIPILRPPLKPTTPCPYVGEVSGVHNPPPAWWWRILTLGRWRRTWYADDSGTGTGE